jgi:hypothetical protein
MFDFVELAAKVLRRGEAAWAQSYFELSLEARRKLQHAYVKSTIDLDNIENLFATYEMASLIGRLSNMEPSLVQQLPKSLRYLIMRTLEQCLLYPITGADDQVLAPYPYTAFAELLAEMQRIKEYAPVAVINFNYDLCLDYALALQSMPVDYGLRVTRTAPGAIPHYKVHGSLNWFRDSATSSIHAAPVRPLPAKTYWDRLGLDRAAERPIDTMELLFGSEKWGESLHPEPIIVPPTWNKGWYQEQLQSVWRNASDALATAENVFVIGYSLPPSDQFFKAFWSISTISDSVIDRFWLFDPSAAPGIVERFSSMLGPAIMDRGKFRFEQLKFTGAIRFIADYLGLRAEASLPDR